MSNNDTSSQPADDLTVDDVFPSRWLKAGDLEGRRVNVTIRRVTLEEMHGNDGIEVNPVVWFKEGKSGKGLILNKTNTEAIARLHGRGPFKTWAGMRITIYPTQTRAFGKVHDVIRIDDRIPAAAKPAQPAQPETESAPPEDLDDSGDLWEGAGPHDTNEIDE